MPTFVLSYEKSMKNYERILVKLFFFLSAAESDAKEPRKTSAAVL